MTNSSDIEGATIEQPDPHFATGTLCANLSDPTHYGEGSTVIERDVRLHLVELLECWPATVRFFKLMSVLFGLNHLCLVARRRIANRVFAKWTTSRTTGAARKRAWRCSRRLASAALKKTRPEIGIGAARDAEKVPIRGRGTLDSFRALDSFGRSGGLATCIAGALSVAARRGAAAWQCLWT